MEKSSPTPVASLASDLESLTTSSDESVQKSNALLNDDPFSNETSKRLFNAIDDMRNCGASQDLDLPQLVIVGNQSAGKSSLLRSLTDIPFSVRGGGLCTRFATRIISRRTRPGSSDLVGISIEPGNVDPFEYEDEHTPDFNHSVPTMTAEAFESVVKHASEYMGILSNDGSKKRNFSSKVLKIELLGPKRSHFSILDVPGVFSVPTDDITRGELDGVDQLVASYMNQPQNIIICVVPANSDLAHQKIFNIVSKNVDSSRIVGVFTKCDTASRKEADSVVKVIKEKKEIQIELGWFVVQNPDFEVALPSNYKEEEEATFRKLPWSQLPSHQQGIASLKEFLAKLLCRQIRVAFPEMQKTIGERLAAQEEKLRRLGDERPDRQQRLQYLMHVVREYNYLAQQALASPESLPLPAMKLRGLARTKTDKFSEVIKSRGEFHPFLNIEAIAPATSLDNPLYREIRVQMGENRGAELIGMMNPSILKPLFRNQSSQWEPLGEAHLNWLISQTFEVAMTVLNYVCEKNGVSTKSQDELEGLVLKFKDESGFRTIQALKKFCRDASINPLYTNNDSFIHKVKYAQKERFRAALERYRNTHPPAKYIELLSTTKDPNERLKEVRTLEPTIRNWAVVDLEDFDALFEQMHPSGVQNKEDEIHDLLKAYYEVARDYYISYMTHHIIEPFLQDPKGPLLGLSLDFIMGLSEEDRDNLGAEDAAVIKSRKEIEASIQRLKEAKRIAELALRKTKAVDL